MERKKIILPAPAYEHIFYMELKQGEDILIKNEEEKEVLLSPNAGGWFEGEHISGRIIKVGTGKTITTPPNQNEILLDLLLKTDDDADILMTGHGFLQLDAIAESKMINGIFIDPQKYYYRMILSFRTANPDYKWLNNKCCVAICGIKNWSTICLDAFLV